MNILFIIKVNIIMLIGWSYTSLQLRRPLSLEWLSKFEHAAQSLLNTCMFGIHYWSHTISPNTQIHMCDQEE